MPMVEYVLTAIDRHFANFIQAEATTDFPALKVVTALLSNGVGAGDSCLDLNLLAGQEVKVGDSVITILPYQELQELLHASGVVGSGGDYRPLVLDSHGRLYLYRYWQYEHELAQTLLGKAKSVVDYDEIILKDGLNRLFPAAVTTEIDWQRVAALAALQKKFCVISGGPGTGKTATVVKILALLLEQPATLPLRIALAAPTGKSAARLKESISQMKTDLDCSTAIKDNIPTEVLTIHRLLGYISGSVQFRYNHDNRLPFDTVIIDEASMVPLTLMAKLAAALKPEARLILLGDRNQLASVEAGAVLGDICGGDSKEPFSVAFNALMVKLGGESQLSLPVVENSPSPLLNTLVVLKKNYRFGNDSGIEALGQAITSGNGDRAITLLGTGTSTDIIWQTTPPSVALKKNLRELVLAGYKNYLAAGTAIEALRLFDQFRILSPLRQGDYGVAAINSLVEEILAAAGMINPQQRWYHGRPVMITVNDYNLQLFNGDIGIVFHEPEKGGQPRVCFPTASGEIRTIPVVRLPNHETVYAMTVHKSQGSEFDRLLLLLPNHDSENLTRELIYTAVTRARSQVDIWGNEAAFIAAVGRQVSRSSGLGDALWGA